VSARIAWRRLFRSAKTETETIEKALDAVLDEHERDRIACEAHEEFMKSRIRDVYGNLED
jgi:hypothetical protein